MRNTRVCVFFFMLTTVLISAVVSPQSGASCDQSEVYRENLKELFPHVSLSQRAHLQSYLEYGSDFFQNPPSTVSAHEYSVALSFWNELQECLRIANRNQRFIALHSWLQQKTIVPFRTLVPHTPLPGLISRLHAAYKKEEPYSWWSMLSFITKIAGGGALLTVVGYLVKYFFIQGIYDRCVLKGDLKPRYSNKKSPIDSRGLNLIGAFINDHRHDMRPSLKERNRLKGAHNISFQDVFIDAYQLPPVGRIFIRKVLESYPAISPEAIQIMHVLYKALNEHLLYAGSDAFMEMFADQPLLAQVIQQFLTANYGDKKMSACLFRLLAQKVKDALADVLFADEEKQHVVSIVNQLATTLLTYFPSHFLLNRGVTALHQMLVERVPAINSRWIFQSNHLEEERFTAQKYFYVKWEPPIYFNPIKSYFGPIHSRVPAHLRISWRDESNERLGFYVRSSIDGALKTEEVLHYTYEKEKERLMSSWAYLHQASIEGKKLLSTAFEIWCKEKKRPLSLLKEIECFFPSSNKNKLVDESRTLAEMLCDPPFASTLFPSLIVEYLTQGMNRMSTHAVGLNMLLTKQQYDTITEEDLHPRDIIEKLPLGYARKHVVPLLSLQQEGVLLEPDIPWDINGTFLPLALAHPVQKYGMEQLLNLRKIGLKLIPFYQKEGVGDHDYISAVWKWQETERTKAGLRVVKNGMKRVQSMQALAMQKEIDEDEIGTYLHNNIRYYFSCLPRFLIPLTTKTMIKIDSYANHQSWNWSYFKKKLARLAEAFATQAIRRSGARYLIDDEAEFYRLMEYKYRVYERLGCEQRKKEAIRDWLEGREHTQAFCFKPARQWQCKNYFHSLKKEIQSYKLHRLAHLDIRLATLQFFKKIWSPAFQDFAFQVWEKVLFIKRDSEDGYIKRPYEERKRLWNQSCQDEQIAPEIRAFLTWWQKNKKRWRDAEFSHDVDMYSNENRVIKEFSDFINRYTNVSLSFSDYRSYLSLSDYRSAEEYIPYKILQTHYVFYEFMGRRLMNTAYHFLTTLYELVEERTTVGAELVEDMVEYKQWCLYLFNHAEPIEMNRAWCFWGKTYRKIRASLPEEFLDTFLGQEEYFQEQQEWEKAFYDKTLSLYQRLLQKLDVYESQTAGLRPLTQAVHESYEQWKNAPEMEAKEIARSLWNSLGGAERETDYFRHYYDESIPHSNPQYHNYSFYKKVSQSLDIPLFTEQEVRGEFIKACQDRLGLAKGYAACRALIESKGGGAHACGVIFDPEGTHADNPAFERDMRALYDFLYSAEGQNDSNEPADQHLVNVLQKFVRLCEYLWTMQNLEPSSMPSLDEVVPPEQETYTDNQVYRVTPEETPATAAGGGGPHHA